MSIRDCFNDDMTNELTYSIKRNNPFAFELHYEKEATGILYSFLTQFFTLPVLIYCTQKVISDDIIYQ